MTRAKSAAAPKPKPADPVLDAIAAAKQLNHTTMRPAARTVACWRCSADGVVGPDGARIGGIFTEECKPK